MSRFLWRLRKKVLKRWARNCFFPGFRITLLRWCGFAIGKDVYIADELIIADAHRWLLPNFAARDPD